ncbi:MAG TPA: prolyl oligopeptidase family serine peptidase [Terriglobales bacterium]|nr:prolyl oligopeptidase family serine peptidase [Terriglobales bacterium]
MVKKTCLTILFLSLILLATAVAQKPPLTLDNFFNSVDITAVKLSPDGRSVVIGTQRADWKQNAFRKELWLYRDNGQGGGSLAQLTQSGHDDNPLWSPDGRWIAFVSDREVSSENEEENSPGKGSEKKHITQIYLISPNGGEAFPITSGEESVHTFAWSPDSRTIYFATRVPWSSEQEEAYKKEWKDVIQYREEERGDTVYALGLDDALARHAAEGTKVAEDHEKKEKQPPATPGARVLTTSAYRVADLAPSPDGRTLAFSTGSISEREEAVQPFEIYSVDLTNPGPQTPRQLTHNNALEEHLRWSPDSRQVFFRVDDGSVEGKYQDLQSRVYALDVGSGQTTRWAANFGGPLMPFEITSTGELLAPARLGTQVQVYEQRGANGRFEKKAGWTGTYDTVAVAAHSPRVAVVFSSLQRPTEVYLAESADKLADARQITAFNKLFTEVALPEGKPYRWTADDGSPVEGMLIYPPGQFGEKHLRMLTLIHGGPADADGDHFEADWYQWAGLAAANGWLVFEPNYRGSSGYGDKFMSQIVPHLVSRPGKDILEGIDALVKDGIADPDHLAVSGYSYGGYMTNWLITQTTRFKAAMTGAGAVEHAANWGNDDLTYDDAFYLGGRPWEAESMYNQEAALWQINKVTTPTHIVGGAQDIRVSILEQYLLEHALKSLGVPCTLLLFPGEGHGLGNNPWHGRIKVREELKWLQKYAGGGGNAAAAAGR